MKSYFYILFFALFIACNSDDDDIKSLNQDEGDIIEYLQTNNLSAETSSSGLYYIIEEEGTGDLIESNASVIVKYTGTFLDGNQFDASSDEGYNFKLEGLIAGFAEGLTHFKKGGKGKLLIPPSLAYGESGNGTIPGSAVLVFDIEVLNVYNPQGEDDILTYLNENSLTAESTDSGLYYIVDEIGDGETIFSTSTINVIYKGYLLDGTEFDNSNGTAVELNLQSVISGFSEGAQLFNTGGKGTLIIPPELAYGETGYSNTIPPNAVVVFDIEITD
ncbi:peptidylprolyl isomerase [Lutibacter oricola]|uniref:Peptidyl-prolyl cis-trans isomerase n=1 Tax=Lutibacter oricola TaxID=762486 RepID=A0A1H2YUL9_9FLAO|nr:FKBP-type peptidyl-prolyl cis-trans isomerase [Lutibacter oricola]SDX08882.1 peptidylprolyl isomerase [Lutibacter oricola]